ncbi:MAG: hypothetical protein QNJ87_09730 [Gammaproteobacteria bacterium]|nr:hypothetical protein [Gammaproteobacteria bacterium]MDJ0893427.1 hypothetical protein [Gammaproteobacteria bacterium]
MITDISSGYLKTLAQTAKTHAIAGASAGVALGIIHGAISVHERQLRDRYDMAAEGLTHVGTGAILGVLGAMATALAGVSVAAITGRRLVAIAVPLVASAVVTSGAHEPVERWVRSRSDDVVAALKRTLDRSRQLDAD